MSKGGGNGVRPWTQGPVVRRRRDKVTIALPAVDTYRLQMEHVQRLYERLRLTEPRRPQTLKTSHSPSSLTSLRRPQMARSHTFAGASDPRRPHRASPVMRASADRSNGRCGQEVPHPEAVISFMDPPDNVGCEPHQESLITEAAEPHDQVQNVGSQSSSPESPHPSRPLAYSYPLSRDTSDRVRQVGRRHGWTISPPNGKTDASKRITRARGGEDEASSSGVSSDDVEEEDSMNKVKVKVKVKDQAQPLLDPSHRHGWPNGGPGELFRYDDDPLDIVQLCEHLKVQGLGEPLLSTQSHNARHPSSLPPGVKARCLPRDPSTREKIKGRARLDYEMANLRAVAFCEQQHPRTFRTASAVFRDRDVRLLEEEERENVHRKFHVAGEDGDLAQLGMEDGDGDDNDHDDESSLVGSPLSREELFLRIEAWAEDVEKALNRTQS